jgi:predicted nucleotidyltransferase
VRDIAPILLLVRNSIKETAPDAEVILYGSYARGDFHEDSDIDLLILIDTEKDVISHEEETKITYPLYHIGYDETILISPMVYSKKRWETKHKVTPFYKNVMKEGVYL